MARTIEELVAEVEALHGELDATASEADELGTAPPALVDSIRKLRVAMVKAPKEIGGDEIKMHEQLRFFEALSYSNPTAGWIGFNNAGAASSAAANLSDDGIETVFGSNPSPTMGGSAAATGTFEHTGGGVLATGTYRYISGVRHADWVFLPAVRGDDWPEARQMVVDPAGVTLDDNWDVMALKGTGSVNVHLNATFVPEHLTADPTLGRKRGGPMFTTSYQTFVAGENLGFTIGVCQRFMDEVAELATNKTRGNDGRLADRGAFQYELGKAQLTVNAARSYGIDALQSAHEACDAAGGLTATEERAVGAMAAFCTESATNAISNLFHFAGAGALFNSSVIQRCFRDAHGSAQHHVVSNVVYDSYGRTMMEEYES